MKLEEEKKLNKILDNAMISIEKSNDEIEEISSFARKEYELLLSEFDIIKKEASLLIGQVDKLKVDYRRSRSQLLLINKNFQKYTEEEMQNIYQVTDELRLKLAVEKQKEASILQRRNDLEVRLKSFRSLAVKADKLSDDFKIALTLLNGNIKELTTELEDIGQRKIWGIRILQAQEEERRRIARDIHDGPAQAMTYLIHQIDYSKKIMDSDLALAGKELEGLKTSVRLIIAEVRQLISNLRPMTIDDLGLCTALERDFSQFSKKEKTDVVFLADDLTKKTLDELNDQLTLTIYRVVQECLTNSRKYANAKRITIKVAVSDEQLIIEVKDDGQGFDVSEIKTSTEMNTGFGLSMLKERVSLLSGNFKIDSIMGKGTRVEVHLPIERN